MSRFSLIVALTLALAGAAPAQDSSPPDKEAQLKQLAQLLKSFTEEDYQKTVKELPLQSAESPQLASRGAALKSVYTTLAAFEYHKAAKLGPPQAASAKYSASYERLVNDDAQAVAIRPDSMQESAWMIPLLLHLGGAAINYALSGGFAAGREFGKTAELERSLAGLEHSLAGAELSAEKKAELHFQKGAAYEQLAAASVEPEPEAVKRAKKQARFKQLAELLQSVSDEEYAEVLKETKKTEIGSRSQVLRSAYVTLAALEYKEAGQGVAQESGAKYSAAYQRVSRDEASVLALNPENLQETGWANTLLHMAELGAIGYLLHENHRLRKRGRSTSPPQITLAPPPANIPPMPPPLRPPDPPPVQPPVVNPPPPVVNPPPKPPPVNPPPPIIDPPVVRPPIQPPSPPPIAKPPYIPPVSPPGVVNPPPACPPGTLGCGYRLPPTPPPGGGGGRGWVPGTRCPPRMRCLASRVPDLFDSADKLENQLVSASSPGRAAELHYKLGSVYEELAAQAITPAAEPADEAPTPKEEPAPKTVNAQAPLAEPAPEQASPEGGIAQEMKEMEKLEKRMQGEVERRRGAARP